MYNYELYNTYAVHMYCICIIMNYIVHMQCICTTYALNNFLTYIRTQSIDICHLLYFENTCHHFAIDSHESMAVVYLLLCASFRTLNSVPLRMNMLLCSYNAHFYFIIIVTIIINNDAGMFSILNVMSIQLRKL